MFLVIGNVLDQHDLAAIREAAAELEYTDGKSTAGRYARDVKANLQARPSDELEAIFATVRGKLWASEVFKSAARPRKVARMLLSRYRTGMEYGLHVDDPIMKDARTDLSFTLPLAPLRDYEGGGLMIDDGTEERVIRVEAGDMVLYPTSALHRVEPVADGDRRLGHELGARSGKVGGTARSGCGDPCDLRRARQDAGLRPPVQGKEQPLPHVGRRMTALRADGSQPSQTD